MQKPHAATGATVQRLNPGNPAKQTTRTKEQTIVALGESVARSKCVRAALLLRWKGSNSLHH
ncbi:MAG: hypothetical protein NT073_05710 [Spirosoma sp.]|nr:hypothetical protein [Spirosoma sp.]